MPNTYTNIFPKALSFLTHFHQVFGLCLVVEHSLVDYIPINHKMNDLKKISKLGETYTTIENIFNKNNYTTFQICSNFRKSPTYNYMLGFDRTLYKANMNCKETIMHTLWNISKFSDNNNYIWMTLFDLHHFVDGLPDISLQKNIQSNNLIFTRTYQKNQFLETKMLLKLNGIS